MDRVSCPTCQAVVSHRLSDQISNGIPTHGLKSILQVRMRKFALGPILSSYLSIWRHVDLEDVLALDTVSARTSIYVALEPLLLPHSV